ncbi:toll/interleukin-1 receptor domain-containing protein, partial [Ruegeria atlantica]|uniref:toll/interleukin-1 receptor domain-containing protein n=1 Tax=Ruegeria atlantica TaxID=81569 RepID=UPI00147FB417
MLKGVSDELLVQLSQHFGFSEPKNDIAGYATSNDQECLYIFISHLAKHKVFASELQSEMAKLGANCFVAHEDIEPDAEWQVEIERALRECDALIALLHDGFSESTWTDQEVGFALGRGAPVFSVRLDVAPYGLFGKKQAFNGKGKSVPEIAGELWEAYKKHPKTTEKASDAVVAKFCKSGSFAEAKANCEQVEALVTWKPEPPQLNWSTVMFRKRRTTNGKQETKARRDCLE